jgi:hypothetical protein
MQPPAERDARESARWLIAVSKLSPEQQETLVSELAVAPMQTRDDDVYFVLPGLGSVVIFGRGVLLVGKADWRQIAWEPAAASPIGPRRR